MNMFSYFLPFAPMKLVYMLQQVEYDSFKFADWVDTIPNLLTIQKRQALDMTARAKATLVVAYILWGVPLIGGLLLALNHQLLGLILAVFAPLFCVVGLFVFNGFFGGLIVKPTEAKEIKRAIQKLENLKALKIAVLGSYGKTTMKEVLSTVLAEGKNVAATPGNKNVLISHARWVTSVNSSTEVLIFEYGEAEPGDISKLAGFSHPEIAIVTGLAPAHMDGYGNLDEIAEDFEAIYTTTSETNVFINQQSSELTARLKKGVPYNSKKVDGWTVSNIKVTPEGLDFTMSKNQRVLRLSSGLMGQHNVGPLAAAVAIASRLGLSDKQIQAGVLKTQPFEHRLQPYNLGGATILDDTYNGNLEGVKAGLALLKSLPAKRKIYVTPGLVEQGTDTQQIHEEVGYAIAAAKPDQVVLMNNSTTASIKQGLNKGDFKGEVKIESDPLNFYTNLQHFVAAGDLVLLQNDWTDNYL